MAKNDIVSIYVKKNQKETIEKVRKLAFQKDISLGDCIIEILNQSKTVKKINL